ncbi:hypothetical protein M378DRAFT_171673 [Amanita muscaria Koide BX008]|uniref:Uncharacterized protein n=1 Tax=Amanita muscaria (strain Koide BX008) TaxID=946122 RepID=A0A0C2S4E7_AMAMK|nr:hypothetical protein M378DRAFT_171673 [Amanita muscaria Koide BX008]
MGHLQEASGQPPATARSKVRGDPRRRIGRCRVDESFLALNGVPWMVEGGLAEATQQELYTTV